MTFNDENTILYNYLISQCHKYVSEKLSHETTFSCKAFSFTSWFLYHVNPFRWNILFGKSSHENWGVKMCAQIKISGRMKFCYIKFVYICDLFNIKKALFAFNFFTFIYDVYYIECIMKYALKNSCINIFLLSL